MKFNNILSLFVLSLFIISCSQFGDSLRLPGEKNKDIIYFELDNDYLAPESREYVEVNFNSNEVVKSYVLIGKNTYGFEADLDNDMSLSFDEDGLIRKSREHPFLKDNYKKGKFDKEDKEGEGRENGRDTERVREREREERGRDGWKQENFLKCFAIAYLANLLVGMVIEKVEQPQLLTIHPRNKLVLLKSNSLKLVVPSRGL